MPWTIPQVQRFKTYLFFKFAMMKYVWFRMLFWDFITHTYFKVLKDSSISADKRFRVELGHVLF